MSKDQENQTQQLKSDKETKQIHLNPAFEGDFAPSQDTIVPFLGQNGIASQAQTMRSQATIMRKLDPASAQAMFKNLSQLAGNRYATDLATTVQKQANPSFVVQRQPVIQRNPYGNMSVDEIRDSFEEEEGTPDRLNGLSPDLAVDFALSHIAEGVPVEEVMQDYGELVLPAFEQVSDEGEKHFVVFGRIAIYTFQGGGGGGILYDFDTGKLYLMPEAGIGQSLRTNFHIGDMDVDSLPQPGFEMVANLDTGPIPALGGLGINPTATWRPGEGVSATAAPYASNGMATVGLGQNYGSFMGGGLPLGSGASLSPDSISGGDTPGLSGEVYGRAIVVVNMRDVGAWIQSLGGRETSPAEIKQIARNTGSQTPLIPEVGLDGFPDSTGSTLRLGGSSSAETMDDYSQKLLQETQALLNAPLPEVSGSSLDDIPNFDTSIPNFDETSFPTPTPTGAFGREIPGMGDLLPEGDLFDDINLDSPPQETTDYSNNLLIEGIPEAGISPVNMNFDETETSYPPMPDIPGFSETDFGTDIPDLDIESPDFGETSSPAPLKGAFGRDIPNTGPGSLLDSQEGLFDDINADPLGLFK